MERGTKHVFPGHTPSDLLSPVCTHLLFLPLPSYSPSLIQPGIKLLTGLELSGCNNLLKFHHVEKFLTYEPVRTIKLKLKSQQILYQISLSSLNHLCMSTSVCRSLHVSVPLSVSMCVPCIYKIHKTLTRSWKNKKHYVPAEPLRATQLQ